MKTSFIMALIVFSACTRKPQTNATGTQTAAQQTAAPAISIGAAIYKYEDTFMSSVREAIDQAAVGKAQISFVDSANQQPTQNEKVDIFLAKKVNVLAINPVDRSSAAVLIEKAKQANTPIVFFNREPLPEDMKKWDKLYYVGTQGEESGRMAGEIIADYWKAHPEADRNKDGILQYVLLRGEPGHQDAELRSIHSVRAIEAAGIKTQKLADDTAMWDRVKGQEKMSAFLGAHGESIEAVIANNDDMALGAIEALKAVGYFQNKRFMPVVGVDATTPAMAALKDGTLLGTVLNDAVNQGRATLNIALALGKGQTPSKENTGYEITDNRYVWIPYKKVTQAEAQNLAL